MSKQISLRKLSFAMLTQMMPFHPRAKALEGIQGSLIKKIFIAELNDIPLEIALAKELKLYNISLHILDSPGFLSPTPWLKEQFSRKKHVSMTQFYIKQRKRLEILVKAGKPIGGKWSFDTENRKKLSKNIAIPTIGIPKEHAYVSQARTYIEKNFASNPGNTEIFIYPTTHKDAKKWLNEFLQKRLALFGTYEDAISHENPILFHSALSPLLNTGLLTPNYVIQKTITYANKHTIPLNSLEGFIRQIIGWREFVRGAYLTHGQIQRKSNFFKHHKKLTHDYWTATTGVLPVDSTIEKIIDYAYAHHIERLMILGNWMLLQEINPNEVYTWFMELFIDAYDWVMVPNVYGMSQYADGGYMTTKPYFSSSNYVRKMSSFKPGVWCKTWDMLFWKFMNKHRAFFIKNPRLKILFRNRH